VSLSFSHHHLFEQLAFFPLILSILDLPVRILVHVRTALYILFTTSFVSLTSTNLFLCTQEGPSGYSMLCPRQRTLGAEEKEKETAHHPASSLVGHRSFPWSPTALEPKSRNLFQAQHLAPTPTYTHQAQDFPSTFTTHNAVAPISIHPVKGDHCSLSTPTPHHLQHHHLSIFSRYTVDTHTKEVGSPKSGCY